MARVDLDELVEHWTLLDDERELIAGKRGPTRLGFDRGGNALPLCRVRWPRCAGEGPQPVKISRLRELAFCSPDKRWTAAIAAYVKR